MLGLFGSAVPTGAQQASQAGVDVRQLERRFEQQELAQSADGVAVPRIPKSETSADPTPLFVLRKVSITGASAIGSEELAAAWQPYIGKKVSQADLAAIAVNVGNVYRAAGFHLSRASVPPQDIAGGTVRIEVTEGSITDLGVKGDGVERFGIRSLL
jgi:hemolysin activation/secretion protein